MAIPHKYLISTYSYRHNCPIVGRYLDVFGENNGGSLLSRRIAALRMKIARWLRNRFYAIFCERWGLSLAPFISLAVPGSIKLTATAFTACWLCLSSRLRPVHELHHPYHPRTDATRTYIYNGQDDIIERLSRH